MKENIIIELRGGVLTLVQIPKGVEVTIRDYDCPSIHADHDKPSIYPLKQKVVEEIYKSDVEVKG